MEKTKKLIKERLEEIEEREGSGLKKNYVTLPSDPLN